MNVLVTGAAGRLGSCVCRLLDELGMTFTAVDCVSDVEAAYSVKIVDLLDWEACEELLKEIDVLIHFASNTKWDSDSPQDVLKENTSMDMNLFQAAANSGCSRIIFSSSINCFIRGEGKLVKFILLNLSSPASCKTLVLRSW